MSTSGTPKILLLGSIDQYDTIRFPCILVSPTLSLLPSHKPLLSYFDPTPKSFSSQKTPSPLSPIYPQSRLHTNCTLSSKVAQDSWQSLSTLGDLIAPKSTNPKDFLAECKSGAFDGVKAAFRTFGSVAITGRIEGEVAEALGKAGLRFLAHNGRSHRIEG